MPDALSKTIPIWCSLVNRVLFPNDTKSHDLYTPPQVVSPSEHAQISALLPQFQQALEALNVPIDTLRQNVTKPLRPIWLTPESDIGPTTTIFVEDTHSIICCTVSRRVRGGEISEGGYIQGAGDDTENWAFGLTPTIFWTNRQTLLSTSEGDLPELIETLVSQGTESRTMGSDLRLVKPTTTLFVSRIAGLGATSVGPTLVILLLPTATEKSTWVTSTNRVDIGIGPHKIGSRNLRAALPIIVDAVKSYLGRMGPSGGRIVVACESGKDASIGVALSLLCLFFDDQGQLMIKQNTTRIVKAFIRGRLGWISTALPDANPNRATLQSVNSYLMDRPV
jgi:tRNA A64-2'-O-ribosylphosphate transferase